MPDPVPAAGTVVQAYVANTSTKGCFLRLSSSLTGRVLLKDLSDEFVHSPVAGSLSNAHVIDMLHTNHLSTAKNKISLL